MKTLALLFLLGVTLFPPMPSVDLTKFKSKAKPNLVVKHSTIIALQLEWDGVLFDAPILDTLQESHDYTNPIWTNVATISGNDLYPSLWVTNDIAITESYFRISRTYTLLNQ